MSPSIYRQFQSNVSYVKQLHRILVDLAADIELVQEGWRLHFAVDFAELFAFAYPLSQTIHIDFMPGEQEVRAFARERVALAFSIAKASRKTLTNTAGMVLLPPYVTEMRAALSLVRDGLVNLRVLIDVYRKLGRRVPEDPLSFKDDKVNRIVREYMVTGQPPNEQDINIIVKYIAESYPELISLVISPTYNGAALLNSMIVRQRLLSLSRYIKINFGPGEQRALGIDSLLPSNAESQKYLDLISTRKGRRERGPPNQGDADACAMLEILNKKLENSRERFLLISHSKTMKSVVRPVSFGERDGRPLETAGIRDLNYFWVYYVHRREQRETSPELAAISERQEILCRVSTHANIFGGYLDRWKAILDGDESPDDAQRCKTIRDMIWRYSNLSLGTETDEELIDLLNRAISYVDPEFRGQAALGRGFIDAMTTTEVMAKVVKNRDLLEAEIEKLGQLPALPG